MPRYLGRAAQLAGTVRRAASRPSVRPWLLLFAAAAFVAMAVGSFRALPDEGRSGNLWLVAVLVLVTTPATLVLNALEYRSMAHALDHDIRFDSAVRVSLVASLANYLPAPGGVAVRTAALKRAGSTIGSALSINAVAVVIWAGAAATVAGVGLVAATPRVVAGSVAAALGLAGIGAAAGVLRRQAAGSGTAAGAGAGWERTFGRLLLVECAMVVVSGLRVWISLAAIGEPTNLGAAVAIASSVVIAALVGIFPAGLGLREGIAGGLAAAVGVAAAAAIAASAVDRVASQIGMALCAPLLGVRWRDIVRSPAAGDSGSDGDGTGLAADADDTIDAAGWAPEGPESRADRRW
jgi:uncharacterized membrane protein YbhN (UPF0104 family)